MRLSTPDSPEVLAPEGIDPIRLEKLNELRAAGRDPFAVERFRRSRTTRRTIVANFEALENQTVSVAGRITRSAAWARPPSRHYRLVGRIQLYVRGDEIGDELYDDVKHRSIWATSSA